MQASIPIEKALSQYGDVLLAYEMNGVPLPIEHGFPVRVVVPGVVGVRNVKWLRKITTSAEEADGPWQRGIAYKGFAPGIKDFKGIDVEKVQSIQEQPVTSVIVAPQSKQVVEVGSTIELKGFAFSGGGRGIVRVDVSTDGGRTWHVAKLGAGADQHPTKAWAWTFWEAEVPVPPPRDRVSHDTLRLCCKAVDSSYNVQPEQPEPIWNIRGLNNNAWHTIDIIIDE